MTDLLKSIVPHRTAYGPSFRQKFETDGPSMTHQSMRDECDINNVMKRYEKTGILEHRNNFEGRYGDFTDVPQDYQESLNAVLSANEMFDSLPARVRRRFHNDPGAFIDFVANPDNQDELIALGLATKAAVVDDSPSGRSAPPKTSKSASKPPQRKSEEGARHKADDEDD